MRAIAGALMLLVATTAIVRGQESSANYYLPLCRSVLSAQSDPRSALCLGFAHAARSYTRDLPAPRRACVPATVANADVVHVIIKFLEQNSRRLNDNFALLAAEALSAAWPCKS